MLLKFSFFLFYLLLITGCIPASDSSENTAVSISNKKRLNEPISLFNTWELTSMNAPSFLFQNSTQKNNSGGNQSIKITFFKENGVQLNLSTNQCGIAYRLKEDRISFQKNISCTEACCDSNQDEFLISQLSGSLKYSIQDSILILEAKEGPIQCKLSAI